MPAKRQYKVKGTNDFLILSAIFFFLCLWAIKDAWFPSEKVLKKHPLQVVAAFEVGGTVKAVNVDPGDTLGEGQVLAELRSDRVAVDYDRAKEEYGQAKDAHYELLKDLKALKDAGASPDDLARAQAQVDVSKQEMDTILASVEELRLQIDSAELKSPSKGVVQEVHIAPHTMVEAGAAAITIDPKDHFYLFNKSLTVLSFILFWTFLAIHILAR